MKAKKIHITLKATTNDEVGLMAARGLDKENNFFLINVHREQCFKYQISAIYRSAKLCTGYRVIYHDMVLNAG